MEARKIPSSPLVIVRLFFFRKCLLAAWPGLRLEKIEDRSTHLHLHYNNNMISSICRQRLTPRMITSRRYLSSSSTTNPNNTKLLLGLAGGGIVVITTGALAYVNSHVGGGDGLSRTISFYSLAIPKYIEYRMHMIMESPDDVWDRLQ